MLLEQLKFNMDILMSEWETVLLEHFNPILLKEEGGGTCLLYPSGSTPASCMLCISNEHIEKIRRRV